MIVHLDAPLLLYMPSMLAIHVRHRSAQPHQMGMFNTIVFMRKSCLLLGSRDSALEGESDTSSAG